MFNNVTEMVLIYVIMCFTNANYTEKYKSNEFRIDSNSNALTSSTSLKVNDNYLSTMAVYDILFICSLAGNISVHIYFLLKSTFIDCKAKCKKKCEKKQPPIAKKEGSLNS